MTKHSKDILADELRKAGLWSMAQRAADGYYHDFLSPLSTPMIQLVDDLEAAGTPAALALRTRAINGEFDAAPGEEEAPEPEPAIPDDEDDDVATHSMGSGPVEPEYAEMMSKIAHGIDEFLNGTDGEKKIGFVLMVFPFSDGGDHERCNYMSNANRAEVMMLLKEQLSYFEGMSDTIPTGHA